MSRQLELALVARDWVIKAEHDLAMAGAGLKTTDDPPTENIGFHAQQVAEKYLMSLLIELDQDIPKSHDLGRLVLMLPPGSAFPLSPERNAA